MKNRSARALTSAALALLALGGSGAGMAHDGAMPQCQALTLQGLYVFSATGYTMPAGAALPKAIVELIDFNGDGTLTVPAATRSINGVVASSTGVGTYSVSTNCTGTLSFVSGPNFNIVVSPNGGELWMIQTDANNVLQGKVTRISPDRGRQ